MGCQKLTYHQKPELNIVSTEKELTFEKSSLNSRSSSDLTNHLGNVMMTITDRKVVGGTTDISETSLTITGTGISVNGNTITSTASGWGNSGGVSEETIMPGSFIEWTLVSPISENYNVMCGISFESPDHSYDEIDYAYYTFFSGTTTSFWESGSNKGYDSPFVVGDVLRIERTVNGNIEYSMNGSVGRSVNDPSQNEPMIIDFSFRDAGSVIQDLKIGTSVAQYDPVVITRADYYPGGMLMPGRFEGLGDQRHLFNGMEHDAEVSGDGNSYTTQFRQYDPRLGRWKSLDPLMSMFPSMSPYVAFANNPILYTDPLGLAPSNDGEGDPPSEEKSGGGDNTRSFEGGTDFLDDDIRRFDTPAKDENAVAEQGNVFLHKSAELLEFNDDGQLTGFVDGEFIYEWDPEKEWYYDVHYGSKYSEGSYSEGHDYGFDPTWDGAEDSWEGFKYMIEDPGKSLEEWYENTDIFKGSYYTTYWTISDFQQGLYDGGTLTSWIEGAPATIGSLGLGFGLSRTLGGVYIPVYRVYGGQATRFGNYWSPINPRLYGSTYRNFAGLPSSNSGALMLKGYVRINQINGFGLAKPIPSSGTFGRLVPELRISNSWNTILWTPSSVFKTNF